MIRKILLIGVLVLAGLNADAGVKVTSLDLKTNGPTGYININLDGRVGELPDLKVYGKTIEILLTGADSFQSISKNVRGAYLSANVLNGKAIVRAVLPYAIKNDGVEIGWKRKTLEVAFPRGIATKSDIVVTPNLKFQKSQGDLGKSSMDNKILSKVQNTLSKENLNEAYLDKLIKEDTAKTHSSPKIVSNKVNMKNDEVKVKQAAIDRTIENPVTHVTSVDQKQNQFSFAIYAIKFTAFLAIVLGVFYGLVHLLKKGVFKRGKLGFLNNSQMIQVLSTTYIAPKRSLMVVKVHKQIFLVSNSETGIQFLSEMTDTNGLMKEGEKSITGTNFDLNLNVAETTTTEDSIKLKENINESTPVPDVKGIQALSAKEIVKFSDELKKKAKKLRPIEFN